VNARLRGVVVLPGAGFFTDGFFFAGVADFPTGVALRTTPFDRFPAPFVVGAFVFPAFRVPLAEEVRAARVDAVFAAEERPDAGFPAAGFLVAVDVPFAVLRADAFFGVAVSLLRPAVFFALVFFAVCVAALFRAGVFRVALRVAIQVSFSCHSVDGWRR
jgi:hypothetical protein